MALYNLEECAKCLKNEYISISLVVFFSFSCHVIMLKMWTSVFIHSLEHPASGYKKIFESCEELAEPIPAHVSGLYAYNLIYQAFSI